MSCFTPFRARVLVDYPPNDKERIVVPSCQYHRCLLLTLSVQASRLRGVIWMHDFKERLQQFATGCRSTHALSLMPFYSRLADF